MAAAQQSPGTLERVNTTWPEMNELREELGADRIRGVLGFHSFIHGVTRNELVRLRVHLDDLVGVISQDLEAKAS